MKDIEKLCMGCMKENEGGGICPHCGYDRVQANDVNYLVPGTRIMKRFLVGKILETNGEGVTYICYDAKTDKTVNLREYFPIGLCKRNKNGSVVAEEGAVEHFTKGLKKFMTLVGKLADHPEITSVPGVVEFFEGNGTGYSVYESFESITLREFLLRNGGTLNWEQTATIFMPLLSTIRALHDIGVLHRGISPETIYIGRDGRVRLSGFCIDDVRSMGTAFTPQIFPGFAAVEQYGSIGEQGTWTDVYAVAATMYRVLVGNPPVESIERVTNDTLTIPQKIVDEAPKAVVEALADALQIIPEERTATVEQFKSVLAVAVAKKKKSNVSTKQNKKYHSYMLLATIVTILLIIGIIVLILKLSGLGSGGNTVPQVSSSSNFISSVESNTSSEEPTVVGTVKVDSFLGKTYQDVLQDIDYSKYNFIIDSKEYSASYSARKIISQYPEAGTMVDPDENGKITVRVVISLGDYNINMPNLKGLSEEQAIIALLKAGFQYDNISINTKYDSSLPASSVIETSPKAGDKVNLDSPVTITINAYTGESVASETASTQSE